MVTRLLTMLAFPCQTGGKARKLTFTDGYAFSMRRKKFQVSLGCPENTRFFETHSAVDRQIPTIHSNRLVESAECFRLPKRGESLAEAKLVYGMCMNSGIRNDIVNVSRSLLFTPFFFRPNIDSMDSGA